MLAPVGEGNEDKIMGKDKRMLQQAFNSLRDSQDSPREFYRIEREKIDFIKRFQKMKSDLRILTAKLSAYEGCDEERNNDDNG